MNTYNALLLFTYPTLYIIVAIVLTNSHFLRKNIPSIFMILCSDFLFDRFFGIRFGFIIYYIFQTLKWFLRF
jgi:small-conductance mechanosensitive channel